ncbi:UNVERIFIED_CONTAM: hypothetical protein RMT77_009212 [Armadillidium vulgare]
MYILNNYFIFSVQRCSSVQFSYNPSRPRGPQFWPSLFPNECGGTRQSPIALNTQTSHYVKFTPLRFSNYNLIPSSGTMMNDGHSVKVTLDYPVAPSIFGGDLPAEYEFVQYHFHWGSNSEQGAEHTLEGEQFPMEMHLVHMRSDLINDVDAALAAPDGIAVLGVFFELGKFDNPILEPMISNLHRIRNEGSEVQFNPQFRLMDFLPLDKLSFYRYLGSLTTPNCNEAVVWTVFTSALPVSERQLNELRELLDSDNNLIVDNFRPIQPLNDRMVYRTGLPKLYNICFIPIICPMIENFVKTFLIVVRAFIPFPFVLG